MKELIKRIKRGVEDGLKSISFVIGRGSAQPDDFPDFLGIGAQKSGTTWLHTCLIAHPEIYLPEEKEVHFFDWKYWKSYSWYRRKFIHAKGRLKGEITPAYGSITERRIRHIARMNPDLKVIYLLRNPIERAWSHSKMVLCKIQGRPFEDISEGEWIAHFDGQKSEKRGSYTETYVKWSRVFGEERIFVGFYEQIKEDPEGLLKDIFRFLGRAEDVDMSLLPTAQKSNVGLQEEIPPHLRAYLHQKYATEIEACCARFGSWACDWR